GSNAAAAAANRSPTHTAANPGRIIATSSADFPTANPRAADPFGSYRLRFSLFGDLPAHRAGFANLGEEGFLARVE
ncbi:MAG TPA: hypothetical protein VIL46_00430, partial [Gemmataceae bacterium]